MTLSLAFAMVAGVVGTAAAAPEPRVPRHPQVADQSNDANYVEQPALGNAVPEADILSVWFTNTRRSLRVHIQTSSTPPHGVSALAYRVRVNPTKNGPECLWFEGYVRASASNATYPVTEASVLSQCEEYPDVPGYIETSDGPDGSGIVTMVFPLRSHPMLVPGQKLTFPNATTTHLVGRLFSGAGPVFTAPAIDSTAEGSSYTIK